MLDMTIKLPYYKTFLIATLHIVLVFLVPKPSLAEKVEVNISNSTGSNKAEVSVNEDIDLQIDADNSSTARNSVKVNGKEYVTEGSQGSTHVSGQTKINVKINQKNGTTTGSVQYNINGGEKTVTITPGDTNTEVKAATSEKKTDTEKLSIFGEISKGIQDLFNKLASLFK